MHYEGELMPNIIGTIISVQKFLENQEAKVFIPTNLDTDAPIILEQDREYIIPDFQREIRWKKENIIELISDINDGERFLGNIILSRCPNAQYEIIDGQQRITALLMLLGYITHISGTGVSVFQTCKFSIESFSEFQNLRNHNFDYESMSKDDQRQLNNSDALNQRIRYQELWNAIEESNIITNGTSRNFLTKLSRCELNILLNTASGGGYSIQYFLDVNLKGIRLDTEDILKGYLFSQDPGSEIRTLWKETKKRVVSIEQYTSKYTLIKIVEQFLYCDLFKQDKFKESGIKFNEKFQLKSSKTIDGHPYNKNSHMVKVINDDGYFRKLLKDIIKYLDLYIDIVSTDGVSSKFRSLFATVNGKKFQDGEIKIIHNLLKKIMLDDNVVPKILIMKYLLEVFILNSTAVRADVKKIYGIYCLAVLFTVFDDKRDSTQITDIVKMNDWYASVLLQVNDYLKGNLTDKRLAAKYTAMLLKPINDTLANGDDEKTNEWGDAGDILSLNTYQYRCKSLATIYNFFKINENNIYVPNINMLYTYLNDERLYSTEHFVLNKSEKYHMPTIAEDADYPAEAKRFVNSLFNFIFVPRAENDKFGNKHIGDKLIALNNENYFQCEYSKMVIEVCREQFSDKPNLDGITDKIQIKGAYTDYYTTKFMSDFSKYASRVIRRVFNQMRIG